MKTKDFSSADTAYFASFDEGFQEVVALRSFPFKQTKKIWQKIGCSLDFGLPYEIHYLHY